MLEEEAINCIKDLFSIPLFKIGFFKFFSVMQGEGVMAARKFWSSTYGSDFLIPNAPEIFEKMVDFYIILGFVPRKRYEKMLEENEKLREENKSLSAAIKELRNNICSSSEKHIGETWQAVGANQCAPNNDKGENVFETVHK